MFILILLGVSFSCPLLHQLQSELLKALCKRKRGKWHWIRRLEEEKERKVENDGKDKRLKKKKIRKGETTEKEL